MNLSNKHTAIICLVLLGTVSLLWDSIGNSQQNLDAQYQQWKKKFGYSFNQGQESYRKLIFLRNLDKINAHNAQNDQTYLLGINQFAHLSEQQFISTYLHHRDLNQVEVVKTSINEQFTVPPNDVDWDRMGKVSPVKNQRTCDAGYAFSSTSLIESLFLIKLNKTMIFSEQQIIDCSANYTTFGCEGGSRAGTLQYLQDVGLNQNKTYPFEGKKGACRISQKDLNPIKYTATTINGCDEIAKKLSISPMTVAVNAEKWQLYKSGIYDGCTSTEVNHDTYLIGVTTEYWRIKNSWGPAWGEYGFIRLKLGNTCGICEKPGFGFQ